ncbi:protein-glutamate methylesterase/protein-glutamine glutaminase [Sporomusa malonica]|uniref:Protein-glutamate methylesterase/protein-glutamine glutaminase n=1 Tax=Sporomusa malonica TaxID=112901 RepID=A0A1W2DLI4_9FIRM|nr:chemotaxis response regulator protein-glutamate methylesterase [Sporomusa malonica]SMC97912.1 two-component system, chemotaxis family, response regulator CheB [Sporomusa malonica]
MGKIKVIVVDDSMLYREVLAKGLSADMDIEVVAKAVDPFDARDKIIQFRPDVMTLDVQMPKMNGIEFLRRLMPQYPLPVIVISSISEAVFDAVTVGAVDFVAKPDIQSPKGVENFINELIIKVKMAVYAKPAQLKSTGGSTPRLNNHGLPDSSKIIAIGASTGGTEAIYNILKQLPPNMPGIVIVQHIPPVFSRMYAERLNGSTAFQVKEARTGDTISPGEVLIAPGNEHMKIKRYSDGFRVKCYEGEKVSGHCPSIDELFSSVAQEAGANSVGVILTGMGFDGAKGLLAMRKQGARTIGQDAETSVVYGMPKVAYNIGAVEKQVALQNVPQVICSMLGYGK